jgi:hypothetical protein
MAERDDFSEPDKRTLGDQVGWRCSRPTCRAPTKGPHSDDSKAVYLGVAAHIHAAAPGGPRYSLAQTSAERSAIDNGIHLCPTCATLVDKDSAAHPAETLRVWKEQAKQLARAELGKASTTTSALAGDRADLRIAPSSLVEVTLGFAHVSGDDSFEFLATIRNTTRRTIKDWAVQIEVPARLVDPRTHATYVPDMSDARRAVFRTSQGFALEKPLWPEQAYTYRLPYKITEATQGVRTVIVRATAYVDGELVGEAQKPVEELTTFFLPPVVARRTAMREMIASINQMGADLVASLPKPK